MRLLLIVLFIFSSSFCIASDSAAQDSNIYEVYGKCPEIKEQIFVDEEGLEFLKEDMANYNWSYEHLSKVLKECNLPILPKDWVMMK